MATKRTLDKKIKNEETRLRTEHGWTNAMLYMLEASVKLGAKHNLTEEQLKEGQELAILLEDRMAQEGAKIAMTKPNSPNPNFKSWKETYEELRASSSPVTRDILDLGQESHRIAQNVAKQQLKPGWQEAILFMNELDRMISNAENIKKKVLELKENTLNSKDSK